MLNLLRMDLYRLFRSKGFYICAGCLVFTQLLVLGVPYVLANPALREFIIQQGATITGDVAELKSASILDLFHQGNVSGGFFSVTLGILASLFICIDFESGFIKNILTAHENKWDYILSKTSCFMLVNLMYLAITYLFCLGLNILGRGFFASVPLPNVLLYLISAWMINNGFTALTMLICIITRNKAFGVAAAICLDGGLIVMIFGSVLGLFNLNGIMRYTLYMNLNSLPQSYSGVESLKPIIIGFVFLVIYTVLSKFVLAKKDI